MRERESGAGRGRGAGARRDLGLLLGLALVMAPAYGQGPESGLAQEPARTAGLELPSPNAALLLSALGSVAAVAGVFSESTWFGLASLTVGPSLGFLYGGCWGRGLLTSGLRLGATLAIIAIAVEFDGPGYVAGYGWALAMTGSMIYDLATVKSSVRRHNAALMAGRGLKVGVSPFAIRKGGGVQVNLSF